MPLFESHQTPVGCTVPKRRTVWGMGACRIIALASLLVVFSTGCKLTRSSSDWQEILDQKAEGGTVELPAGNYGPLIVRRAVTVKGRQAKTRLSSLVVDENVRGVRLQSLVLVGTKEAPAVDVRRGASVYLDQVDVECEPGSPTGLFVSGAAEASELTGGKGCERAFDVQQGSLILRSSEVVGERTAVRLVDASLEASNVRLEVVEVINGAALASARSKIRLDDVSLSGGEQTVLARSGRLEGERVRVSGSVTGIALVQGAARLKNVWLHGPFTHAALMASDAPDVRISGLVVEKAGATGVLAVRATLKLSLLSVSGARSDADGDFGNGVTLQTSRAEIDGLTVKDAQRAGLYAAKSTAQVSDLDVRESGVAVAAVNGATVTIHRFSKDEVTDDVVSIEASTVRISQR